MLGRIPSAETKAWICTADDCFNVMPQLHKTFGWQKANCLKARKDSQFRLSLFLVFQNPQGWDLISMQSPLSTHYDYKCA